MLRILLYAAAIFILLHGLVHLMGFVVYWPLGKIKGLPYKTTLLSGKWDLGRSGTRLFSVFWLAATIAFVVSAYTLAVQHRLWFPLLLGSSLLSLAITALDWATAFRGAIINAAILAVLVIYRLYLS